MLLKILYVVKKFFHQMKYRTLSKLCIAFPEIWHLKAFAIYSQAQRLKQHMWTQYPGPWKTQTEWDVFHRELYSKCVSFLASIIAGCPSPWNVSSVNLTSWVRHPELLMYPRNTCSDYDSCPHFQNSQISCLTAAYRKNEQYYKAQ